ncbi:uncharacterized protein LOC114936023 [Nylanderia fulva]|uniref:uncharacterized protein LOC114936023 n=1 Tax=Nylanderia fulva TaxID=613905 RepID=UPI0010FB3AF2|nr:uncharacterized protein LOC114936023 [Nylanderia fulva]
MEKKLGEMNEWMEEEGDRVRTIIGGDFNARTGNLGGRVEIGEEEGEEGKGRKSRDTKVNGEGRRLVKKLEEKGWAIMNGGIAGDEEGGWAYMGPNGKSVIDYIIGNEEVREEIRKLEIGERMDSDHMPLIVWLEGKGGGGERKGKKRRRWNWTEEGKEEFREKIGEIWGKQRDEQEEEGVEGEWEEKKKKIQEVLDKGNEREGKEKKGKKRGWFDRECRREKGEVVKELKRWRRIGGKGEEYRKRKKKYERLCRKKKEEENEEWTKKAMEARTEGQVWEVVRRERGKGKGGMGEGIEMEEWNRYFRDLLGGVESRVIMGGRRTEKERGEDQIEKEEIRRAIGRIKERKAVGVDGIPGEVWKFGGEGIEKWVWELCNKIWKGEGWIREWSEGLVVPILKRGEGKEVSEYRGVTLTPSLYKVYATVLAERLRGEIEEKGMLPPNQTGFRKGMGTVDNIYSEVDGGVKREGGEGRDGEEVRGSARRDRVQG